LVSVDPQADNIIRSETLVRWHREGFAATSAGSLALWEVSLRAELRALIGRMSQENPLWGAPRIHGELLRLGFAVAPSTVGKYMARKMNDDPSGQSWATFPRNHRPKIAAIDLFVVPTIGFNLLYAFDHCPAAAARARLGQRNGAPTAEWIARQIIEAFPRNEAPRYLIRDRDRIHGTIVRRRLRAMGIRDKPISLGSPEQTDVIVKRFLERLMFVRPRLLEVARRPNADRPEL
jgi:hypothetical protein